MHEQILGKVGQELIGCCECSYIVAMSEALSRVLRQLFNHTRCLCGMLGQLVSFVSRNTANKAKDYRLGIILLVIGYI